MISNDNDYSAKFDQMYKFYNQLLTDVLSYRTPTGTTFKDEQSAVIKSLNKNITNTFVSFLENDLIDSFNFNRISLLLNDFERALLHKGLKDKVTLIELNSSDNLGMRAT